MTVKKFVFLNKFYVSRIQIDASDLDNSVCNPTSFGRNCDVSDCVLFGTLLLTVLCCSDLFNCL